MPAERVDIAEPFFGLTFVRDEPRYRIEGRAIVVNLGPGGIGVEEQTIGPLSSVILHEADIRDIRSCVVIDRFDAYADEAALMAEIRSVWPSAFEVRGEERLRSIAHYMSPKAWIGQVGLTVYHSASVPLNVGLHRDHPFCDVPGFREVHTQIMGLGKMQQCREKALDTLYLEETMAPGVTHKPMFDAVGNYPWHQFETITPSVFLAIEMLPDTQPVPQ